MSRPERLWLSCTKSTSRPNAANFCRFQDSRKKPRASPNTFGRRSNTSGISSLSTSTSVPARENSEQILPVFGLLEFPRDLLELGCRNEARSECDFLRAADL